jgi:hypothetical protein
MRSLTRPRATSRRPSAATSPRSTGASRAYELIHEGSRKARTTSWAPEDGGVVKQVLAKHWTSLAAAKGKITGKKAE